MAIILHMAKRELGISRTYNKGAHRQNGVYVSAYGAEITGTRVFALPHYPYVAVTDDIPFHMCDCIKRQCEIFGGKRRTDK